MKKYFKLIIIIILLIVVINSSFTIPIVFSRTITPFEEDGTRGNLHFCLSSNGEISWNRIPGVSTYSINIRDNSKDKSVTGKQTTTLSFNIVEALDELKQESGSYKVTVTPNGMSDLADNINYNYVSPYYKIEAPSNLRWEGNTAKWDDVENETGYEIELYTDSGEWYNTFTLPANTTQQDFSNIVTVGNDWYFKVKATSTEYCRPSVMNESHEKVANYIVTFDSNGGSNVVAQAIKKGEKIVRPYDPTKLGSTFYGWFSDKELLTPFDFDSPITNDITLYAKWIEITGNITPPIFTSKAVGYEELSYQSVSFELTSEAVLDGTKLSFEFSGTDKDSFEARLNLGTLNGPNVWNIVGIRPKTGLAVGTYTAYLELNYDTDNDGYSDYCIATAPISFTVNSTPLLIKGDINGDGNVTLYDAFTILRKVILGNELTEVETNIMDYNDDNKVTLYDAFSFLRQVIMA